MDNFDFFVTTMPKTRLADYYLGCLDGAVFLDFNNINGSICLIRISFDSYGCCNLGNNAIPLDKEDSSIFKKAIKDVSKNQDSIEKVVKKAILLNKYLIWEDALDKYFK